MPPTGAAAAPAAASSTASLAPVPPSELNKHDRVRVKCNSAEQSDDGTVTDTTTKLVTATESVGGAFVAYDDGCRNWHFDRDDVTIWRLSAAATPLDDDAPAAAGPPPSEAIDDDDDDDVEEEEEAAAAAAAEEEGEPAPGQLGDCPICMEAIESLGGFVPLPCAHNVCVSCMDSLISAPATCESQQPHNRGHAIQAEWANRCPECRCDFSRRDIVALLERGVGARAAAAATANEAEVRAARRPTDPAALATLAAAREQNERRTAQLREQARKGRK